LKDKTKKGFQKREAEKEENTGAEKDILPSARTLILLLFINNNNNKKTQVPKKIFCLLAEL
jgi:hypothetical protein